MIDLDLQGVRTASAEHLKGRELLRVDFPDSSPAPTLWLQMKPDVAIAWSYNSTD
ncbi:hypothetical protein [Actinoplanes sp. CA-252034]|uniref:hypothetical protein n=1 Tax=Actinoplanes sp. CA-252034 TaxID=3239906 RepID=UPI003D991631